MAEMMTLRVPAVCWEAFRAGALHELAYEGAERERDFLTGSKEDLSSVPDQHRDGSWGDYRDYFRYIGKQAELMVALVKAVPPSELPERDVEITAPEEAVYHALHETMVRFAFPLATYAANGLPPNTANVEAWTGVAEWALAEMANIDGRRADLAEAA